MYHPAFRQFLLDEQAQRLERVARLPLPPGPAPRRSRRLDRSQVSLRLCTVHDDGPLERLAELEGRPLPRGRFVVAEVDGRLVAALPLAGGSPLADPFAPTAHLLPLMRLRARQLAQASPRRWPALRRRTAITGA